MRKKFTFLLNYSDDFPAKVVITKNYCGCPSMCEDDEIEYWLELDDTRPEYSMKINPFIADLILELLHKKTDPQEITE